jgi:hypothetical protein
MLMQEQEFLDCRAFSPEEVIEWWSFHVTEPFVADDYDKFAFFAVILAIDCQLWLCDLQAGES